MKNYSLILKPVQRRMLAALWLGYAALFPVICIAQTNNLQIDKSIADQIVAAIPNAGLRQIDDLFEKDEEHRQQLAGELLRLLNAKDSNDCVKCYAAYYLGILHSAEAVDSLASQITLNCARFVHSIQGITPWRMCPATAALVAIGAPSIPAMIRNVSASDDAQVVKLSLAVLCRIDGDKDIVRLRLQKALEKEPDKTKQARLQTALTTLTALTDTEMSALVWPARST